MPRDSATPVGQGGSPKFSAPAVSVATPGRQLEAQSTEAEDFFNAIVGFGRGVASAVSARASINSRLKSLKDQSMAQVESDLNRAARSFQDRRLETADATRRTLIAEAEAGDRSIEDLERNFRSRMANASSSQEAALWEQAWQGAAAQVSRENEQSRRQAFNSAKMTMTEVSLQLQEQLAESPELQASLQGNGSDIGARVQNWMLTEIQSQIDLDSLSSEDAELLIHQTIVQSAGIADRIRGVHQKQVESSNLSLGTRQMTSDIISTASGEQDSVHLREQIEVTLRDQLAHLTPEQQSAFVRDQLVSALGNIANGSLGIDAADAVTNATQLLNLTVNGEKVFNAVERQALAVNLAQAGERTIQRESEAAVTSLKESTRIPIQTGDGVVFRPNPEAEAMLLIPDDLGRDAFDRAADRILAEQGLLGLESPSPEQALMIGRVRQTMDRQRQGQRTDLSKAEDRQANWVSVLTGRTGDGNKAYQQNPFTRAKMGPTELAANKLGGMSSSDITFVRTALQGVAQTEAEQAMVASYEGQPLEYTEENREMHRLMSMAEARQWQEGEVQAVTGLPTKLVEEKTALLKSNDPLRVEAFTNWAVGLDSGAGEGWSNFLDAVSPNEAAAGTWLRQHGRLGQTGTNQNVEAAPLDLMDQAQTILNAPGVEGWLRTDTGTEDAQLRFSNARAMSETLAAIIAEENPDADFNEDGNLLAQINNMIVSDRNATGRAIRQLWFAGKTVNPTMDDGQVGTMIYHWMRKDGLRFRTVGDRVVMVSDPLGYTGEQGADVQDHVNQQFLRPFTGEYRDFLQQAMGIDTPADVPLNLQHMLVQQNETLARITEPFEPNVLSPEFNFRDQSSGRMLESRANYGGFVVGGRGANGIVLNPVISVNDAAITWADGTSVFVPKGTVLNIINPDLFAPSREETSRPGLTSGGGGAPPVQSITGGRGGGLPSPSVGSANVPFS